MTNEPAKQSITQRVRDAIRQRQYQEFKDRIGDTVDGLVKLVVFGDMMVDLGHPVAAMLPRDQVPPDETFRQGDSVCGYIYDVRPESRGPQIFMSRTYPQFIDQVVRRGRPPRTMTE